MDYSIYIALSLYFLVMGAGWALSLLNVRHLEAAGGAVPPGFEGHVDGRLLERMREYTVEGSRFALFESVFGALLAAAFVVLALRSYDGWLASFGLPFIVHGLVFFMLLIYAEAVLSAPFSLYRAFVIEKKYGFSNMTASLWLSDWAKSLLLTTVLGGVLLGAALWIIKASPDFWWLWVWGFFFAFSIFMMYLSPHVIEPLFNRFEEVEDPALKERILEVLAKAGITVAKVQKVDASRRTSHTNAYFTGIGSVKRIVLYDTLLKRLDNDEIVSVLAHETGHWKGRHLMKGVVLMEAAALAVLFAAWLLLGSGLLEELFNMPGSSFFGEAVMLGFLAPVAAFPFTPFFSWFSRRHEREADRFVIELSRDPEAFTRSLVKLSKDNLSNLHPHPLYAAFYYSHPPVVERVREIRKAAKQWTYR
ncbi:STE24 endopeptidase [uncultured bacterium]|nr:STE24 endopeptidase [uncultured bacterium]